MLSLSTKNAATTLRRCVPVDLPRPRVPHCNSLLEVRIVRHVTGDGGVVTEGGVFHRRLAGAHGVKEIPQVFAIQVVARGRVEAFARQDGLRARLRIVLHMPFFRVVGSRLLGPRGVQGLWSKPSWA